MRAMIGGGGEGGGVRGPLWPGGVRGRGSRAPLFIRRAGTAYSPGCALLTSAPPLVCLKFSFACQPSIVDVVAVVCRWRPTINRQAALHKLPLRPHLRPKPSTQRTRRQPNRQKDVEADVPPPRPSWRRSGCMIHLARAPPTWMGRWGRGGRRAHEGQPSPPTLSSPPPHPRPFPHLPSTPDPPNFPRLYPPSNHNVISMESALRLTPPRPPPPPPIPAPPRFAWRAAPSGPRGSCSCDRGSSSFPDGNLPLSPRPPPLALPAGGARGDSGGDGGRRWWWRSRSRSRLQWRWRWR